MINQRRLPTSVRDFLRPCLSLAAGLGLGLAVEIGAAEAFEPFLQKHCIACHGPEKEKGDLRIDQLSREFKLGADAHHWAEVVEQINSSEMPPKKQPRPTQENR